MNCLALKAGTDYKTPICSTITVTLLQILMLELRRSNQAIILLFIDKKVEYFLIHEKSMIGCRVQRLF
jgi:hypothetical protein